MESAAGETIRQLLNRRDLASARHRAAMSRRLGLSESEMLAVAHLAQHPGRFQLLLQMEVDQSSMRRLELARRRRGEAE